MDFNAVRAVREYEMPSGLRPYKVQLLVLITCWDRITDEVFPSEETLSKWCGCGVSTIRTAMHKLQSHGFITIRRVIPAISSSKYPVNHYGVGPTLRAYLSVRIPELQKLPPKSGASS